MPNPPVGPLVERVRENLCEMTLRCYWGDHSIDPADLAALCEAVETLTAERGQLRQRVEQAEKAAKVTIEDCRRQGVSLGRGLANYGYQMAQDELAALRAEVARLEAAIRWALGETDEFRSREAGDGAFWWRTELCRRAFRRPPQEQGETR